MKIVGIAVSPRRNANSETLLDRALAGMKGKNTRIKKIILANLRINPCNGCLACHKTGECIIKDDMQAVYEDVAAADVLLVSSPIYFMGLPCQLKCVIDRCQALWARKHILEMPSHPCLSAEALAKAEGERKRARHAAAILVSASSGVKNMFTGAIITLRAWFRTLDAESNDVFIAEGLEGEIAALKNKRLLEKALEFGRRMSMSCGKCGKKKPKK